ncbi:hypothetical protein [Vulcanisaeta souniana]|uniref:hypothetical protein n=1 Tax=Vulcanisaeta souniana TaxID=164452 RepID=UPI0006D0C5D8|nr:hypothetical protein [Vulcanisaeta souniana]
MLVKVLKEMGGFRRDDEDDYWFKDYGNDVVLKVASTGYNEMEIELDMPVPTDINSSSLNKPEKLIEAIMNSSLNKGLLSSLLHAINDMIHLKLIINLGN